MEYTVEFYKSSVKDGKTIIHETTLCESDETMLKREVTKIAKTLDPFKQLQAEAPTSWESYGYRETESYNKRWTSFDQNFPLDEDASYNIHVIRTSAKFATAQKKVYDAQFKINEGLKELTDRHYSNDPDISVLDPEIAKIIKIDLVENVQALINLFEATGKRLIEKIEELNNRT